MSKLKQEEFELIEAYLQERMVAEERTVFEKRLEQDAALRNEVAVQKENTMAVELGAFSESIEKIAQDYAKKDPAIDPIPAARKGLGKWIGIAAGLAVLLAITIWITSDGGPSEQIFAEHFVADPGLPVTMGATDNYTFNDAMVDYKSKQYQQAISKWIPLLEISPTNDTLNYYLGSAHLNMGKAERSIPYFETVVFAPASGFSEKAQWYLALAYIKTGKQAELNALDVESNNSYGIKIKDLRSLVEKQ